MKTIIKGAIYKDGDELLRPHFTGEFWMVDCTEYKTKENILEDYDADFANKCLENTMLTYDDVTYYECEYSPHHTENFELLSDITAIEFYDDETDF